RSRRKPPGDPGPAVPAPDRLIEMFFCWLPVPATPLRPKQLMSEYRGATDEFLGLHRQTPMNCRGLSSTGCHSATNASSLGSGFCGSISFSVKYSSTFAAVGTRQPRPFSRRTRPVFDHFGTATVTAPPG